jgi:L-lactate utilization protein LutC
MKITKNILRKIITEEINNYLAEETQSQQQQTAVDQISNILTRAEKAGKLNAQDIINQAKDSYEDAKTAGADSGDEMEDEDAIDEGCADGHSRGVSIRLSSRKEKAWTDADHKKQEKLAKEIEKENPGISKQKKMAFAGAQVNREKRKRNK